MKTDCVIRVKTYPRGAQLRKNVPTDRKNVPKRHRKNVPEFLHFFQKPEIIWNNAFESVKLLCMSFNHMFDFIY